MVRPIRRIVAGNDDGGKAVVLSDGPSPDVLLDPARPGFASTRLWVSDHTPAKVAGIRETLNSPHRLEPPANGTMCRFVEFPPDGDHIAQVSPAEVKAWFESMQSGHAQVAGPHPYMQRTRSLDLCYVLEGELTLVLDQQEVDVRAGNAVVINGARHAWSNRSKAPAIVIMSQHGGVDKSAPEPPSAPHLGDTAPPPANVSELIRRVIVGQDEAGKSCVVFDGPVQNIFPRPTGAWFYELWTLDEGPAHLAGNVDAGRKGRSVMHSPPAAGANWRISFSATSKPPEKKVVSVESGTAKSMDTGGGTERRHGGPVAGMHRTPSLDYAICLEGDRVLLLEDSEVVLNKGDVVIQCGNWHSWGPKSDVPTIMSYVMIGGEFG
jgi:quercetin dioxygenase-like cupin family protein